MASVEEYLQFIVDNPTIGPFAQTEYGLFAIVVGAFLLLGGAFHFVLKGFFMGLTKKTKTDIDDKIFDIIKLPIFVSIVIFGAHLAAKTLSFVEENFDTVLFDQILFVIYVFIGAYTITKIVNLLISRTLVTHGGIVKTPKTISIVINLVVLLGIMFTLLVHFGVDVTAGIAALGVGGIAIGLALQGTLRDFFSGLHIVTDKSINIGDYIEVKSEGMEGFIEDIGWRSTRIRTLPNNIVVIPNSKISESTVMNTTIQSREMGVVVNCGVSYESDLDKVEKVTLEVAKDIQQNTEGAVKDFNPLVRYKIFGDSNIEFIIVLRVTEFIHKSPVTHAFIKALKKRYDEEGIEISWPVRKVFYGNEKKE